MRRTIVFFLLISFGIFFTVSVVKKMAAVYKASGRLAREQTVVQKLDEEHKVLQTKIEAAKEPDFIEREARDNLNLSKPGETIIVLPNFQATQSASVALAAGTPNWLRWWRLLFD